MTKFQKGFTIKYISDELLTPLVSKNRELIHYKKLLKEQMKEWFLENYQSPECSCSRADGNFIWIDGPFNANEMLFSEFDEEYPEDLIIEAAEEIGEETGCYEWESVVHDQDDDADLHETNTVLNLDKKNPIKSFESFNLNRDTVEGINALFKELAKHHDLSKLESKIIFPYGLIRDFGRLLSSIGIGYEKRNTYHKLIAQELMFIDETRFLLNWFDLVGTAQTMIIKYAVIALSNCLELYLDMKLKGSLNDCIQKLKKRGFDEDAIGKLDELRLLRNNIHPDRLLKTLGKKSSKGYYSSNELDKLFNKDIFNCHYATLIKFIKSYENRS